MLETVSAKVVPAVPPQSWATSVQSGRGRLLWARMVTLLLIAAVVVGVGMASDSSVRYSLTIGTIFGVAVLGNNAVTGTLREINLAAGAYMAIGGYAMAWGLKSGLGPASSVLLVLAVGVVLGALLAVPIVRLKGIFTALATFAMAYAIPDLSLYLSDLTGGDAGTAVPPIYLGDTLLDGSSTEMLVLTSALMAVLGLASLMLFSGRVGERLLLVGESPAAARVFGVRVTAVQVAVWTWATVLGAVAGALYAMTVGFLNPTVFVLALSIEIFVAGLIGGTRSVPGAWIGGLIVGALPHNIQSVMPATATGLVFGSILLIALMAGSGGLGGAIDRVVVALGKGRRA